MGIASDRTEVYSEARNNDLIWFNISTDFGIPHSDFSMMSNNKYNYPALDKALCLERSKGKGRI